MDDGRGLGRTRRITKIESAYDGRHRRHDSEGTGQRQERRVGLRAGVPHLAGASAFTCVMHRTHLAGQQARTAHLLVVGSGHVLAAEGDGRGYHSCELAGEGRTDQPRQMSADNEHEPRQLTTQYVGMIVRGLLHARPIQLLAFLVSVCLFSASLKAQDEHHHPVAAPATTDWSWTTDANVIAGYNYQGRKFADFWAWESQNWMMLSGERALGPGRLTLQGMLSFEPFTIGRLVYANGLTTVGDRVSVRVPAGGSPQAFQTGESYQRSPLINYQHPHDLLMGLGATYRFDRGPVKYFIGADLVGSPALGPTPYMHRESGRDNPSAPLTHHYLDSTHSTPGVVRGGVEVGQLMFEASTFRGAEPDEDRLNIERPRLDSWSARTTWRRGSWQAQFSGGRLHEPEWFEPVDVTRLTASIGFNGAVASRPLAVTAAWGENREIGLGFALDGYLLEWDLRATRHDTVYGRAESVLKEIFGLGVHPRGLLNHPRNFSHIDALTIGYVRDLPSIGSSRLGIGVDTTLHWTSADLVEYYGSPRSYHVFLRWRPDRTAPAHIH